MKRSNILLVLAIALVCGIGAGYLALNYLQSADVGTAVAKDADTTPVVVAARDLPAGTILGPQDVKTVAYPAASAPAGIASDQNGVVGRGLITRVSTNEPLLAAKLAGQGEGGLPVRIPKGMRALSVRVDEVIGVAGFVLPDTRVDVLVTVEDVNEGEVPTTKVILQNIQVLTAGQTTERDAEGQPKTVSVVTLLVTPEQAEELTLASTEGRIHLALRNMGDTEEIETDGAQKNRLVSSAAPPQPRPRRTSRAPARSATTQVETYNGSERTITTF